MGARFAPSYANLFMGYWEEGYIWANNPYRANLIVYARYIDDILIIWDGTAKELAGFLKHCGNNPFGISFTHVVDDRKLVFLDLELSGEDDGTISSKTHFKPSGGNSYLHASSNHHPRWIRNIPFGQFCRLHRTCTKRLDYEEQGAILKRKFAEKGYKEDLIEEAFMKYWLLYASDNTRKLPVASNNKISRRLHTLEDQQKLQHTARFSTTYSTRAFEIQHVLQKNWKILRQDPVLKDILPERPEVVFRKPMDLRGLIAPSRVRKEKKNDKLSLANPWLTIFEQTGNYKCGVKNCGSCIFMLHRKREFVGLDGRIFKIKQFINCGTNYVVYALICPCGLLYVGRTIRPLRVRFGEHKNNILCIGDPNRTQRNNYSVPRHFREHHNADPSGLKLFGIEAIKKNHDEGVRFQTLCRRETFWIFSLGSLAPGGLNEDLEVHGVV